jgi:hypothetical protein
MKKQAYIKPEARALMIQQSGDICDNIIKFSAEGLNYGGSDKDYEGDPQARANFDVWEEEEEDNEAYSKPKPIFKKEAFLSPLR